MLKNFFLYPLEFILLGLILVTFFILFLALGYSPQNQRYLIYLTGGLYWLWSLFYHWRRGDLTLSILVEYLMFALFGIVVLLSTVI